MRGAKQKIKCLDQANCHLAMNASEFDQFSFFPYFSGISGAPWQMWKSLLCKMRSPITRMCQVFVIHSNDKGNTSTEDMFCTAWISSIYHCVPVVISSSSKNNDSATILWFSISLCLETLRTDKTTSRW